MLWFVSEVDFIQNCCRVGIDRFQLGAERLGRFGAFADCDQAAKAGTVVVTIVAGPLNWLGINPKIKCDIPQPSK